MALLHPEAPSSGYMVLPSGIAFTREQASLLAALCMFPGWKPAVDALRHLAVEAQDRLMSRYASMDEMTYEKGYINALEEVVNLIEVVVPEKYASLLSLEGRGNGSEGSGRESQSE